MKKKRLCRLISAALTGFLLLFATWAMFRGAATAAPGSPQNRTVSPGDVVINEVAWGGTAASSADEWIELYNVTAAPITLTGWSLAAPDGSPSIALCGVIPAQAYFLLERTDDDTVSDVPADQIYTGGLVNDGETLLLTDPLGACIDTANADGDGWPAGSGSPNYDSMERVDPIAPDTVENWASNDHVTRNGCDADGAPINGTPRTRNSACATPPQPQADLSVAKTGPTLRQPGQLVTYTIRLSNTGQLTATSVYVTDSLPSSITFLAQESAFPFDQDSQTLQWTIGNLPTGATSQRIIITGRINTAASGVARNTVTATTATTETTITNNHATFDTHIGGSAGEAKVLIAALLYDGYQTGDADEAVQLVNVSSTPVNLGGWQLADGTSGAVLPSYTLPPGQMMWIARDSDGFAASFGFLPTLDAHELGGSWPGFANGTSPNQDEVILRDASSNLMDVLIYETGDASVGGWSGPGVEPYALGADTGQILYRIPDQVTGLPLVDTHTAADWAQYTGDHVHGRRVRYPGWDDTLFWPLTATETASLTVAIAPDAAYDLIYQAITRATTRIDVASYTLEHARLAQALADKAAQGVDVNVLLEGEPVGGVQNQERWACQQIEAAGGECWFMHHYPPDKAYDRYDQLHAKYLIIDNQWTLIGSENLNPTGLPDDDKRDGTAGRRGAYVMTNAPSIAARTAAIFAADLDPAHHSDLFRWQNAPFVSGSDVPTDTFGLPPPEFTPVYASGGITYTARFSTPLTLSGQMSFELFTAPEAALRQRDALLGLIAQTGAGDELLIEMLYERAHWGSEAGDTPSSAPNLRLEAFLDAARRGARVRLLLDRHFDDPRQSWSNAETARYVNQIAQDEGLDLQARLGDPTGGGLHNKLILARIDGQGTVHLGSLNGSEASNKINRELVLQVSSDALYAYLGVLFNVDWNLSAPLYLPLVTRNWTAPAPPVGYPVISEVLYNPIGAEDSGEWVELYNPTDQVLDLAGWYLGDTGPAGEFGSGLYAFPLGTLVPAGGVILITRQAADAMGCSPDLEFLVDPLRDAPDVPNMIPAGSWDGFGFALGNTGDEVILLDSAMDLVDALAYGSGSCAGVIPHPGVAASGHSLERRPAIYDTNDCSQDFFDRYPPDPGQVADQLTIWPRSATMMLQ